MIISVEEYQKLQKQLDKLTKQRSKAEGALQEIMRTLKEHFDCDSIEEAEELLLQLQEQEKETVGKIANAETKFRRKYGKYLEE